MNKKIIVFSILLALSCFSAFSAEVQAATYTVDTPADNTALTACTIRVFIWSVGCSFTDSTGI